MISIMGKTVKCWPGADDLIQLIFSKVIAGRNITI